MPNPKRLIEKAPTVKLRAAFKALFHEIGRQRFTPSERQQIKSVILTKTVLGELTPSEAKKLTMALGRRSKP
jgi:hypothetical protein